MDEGLRAKPTVLVGLAGGRRRPATAHAPDHWRAAEEEGRHAAAAMLGRDCPAEGVPFCWTQMGGPPDLMVGLHMVGRTDPELECFDTGDIAANDFTRWHVADGEVVGATGSGASDRTAGYHLARLLTGRVSRKALEAAGWDPAALL